MNTQDFLLALRKLEKLRLAPRDPVILLGLIHNPGLNGHELTRLMNLGSHTSLERNMFRLIDRGFVEDRRIIPLIRSAPYQFHATDKGREFWNDLKPKKGVQDVDRGS